LTACNIHESTDDDMTDDIQFGATFPEDKQNNPHITSQDLPGGINRKASFNICPFGQ
jgi:hypothetical protein